MKKTMSLPGTGYRPGSDLFTMYPEVTCFRQRFGKGFFCFVLFLFSAVASVKQDVTRDP